MTNGQKRTFLSVNDGRRTRQAPLAAQFHPWLIGLALVAPDGRWLRVNLAFCALLGYSVDELLARTF